MKRIIRTSVLVLTGALLMTACGNKEQKTEANVNENPAKEIGRGTRLNSSHTTVSRMPSSA